MSLPLWYLAPPSGHADEPERLPGQIRRTDVVPAHSQQAGEPIDIAESAIVDRIRAGDLTAFEGVYRATYTPLWRFAYRIVQSADVAHDVVHDVFLSLWARRHVWSIQTTVRAYLYGAVRQRAFKDVRHQQVVDRTAASVTGADIVPPGMGELVETPDVQAERHALVTSLRHAIMTLPERQRLAMVLYLEGDLMPVEIAAALDISAVAARKLIAKGAAHLRTVLPEL